jgi:hypothetical protein
MARSRRPELEKDNSMAPQPHAGPRRKRARQPRAVSSPSPGRPNEMGQALLTLMETAERFVNGAPRSKKLEEQRNALLDAITQAQWLLSVEHVPAKRARRT